MMCPYQRYVKNVSGKAFLVPCGQCLACRINRTTEWTIRLLMELRTCENGEASFVTLTYNDANLPSDYSLHKEDFQKFMKRLRKDLAYDGRTVRYFACGEYGLNPRKKLPTGFGRPHYHAIIFGLDPNDDCDRELVKSNWTLCNRERFDRGKKSGIGTVTSDSIQYVTGYIRKKLLGESIRSYKDAGIIPPFQVQSKFLGLQGFEDYMLEYNNPDFIMFNGHKISIPRYFREKFLLDNGSVLESIRAGQEQYLKDKRGLSDDDIKNMRMNTLNTPDGRDLVQEMYYETIRSSALQNLENIKKRMTMKSEGDF